MKMFQVVYRWESGTTWDSETQTTFVQAHDEEEVRQIVKGWNNPADTYVFISCEEVA